MSPLPGPRIACLPRRRTASRGRGVVASRCKGEDARWKTICWDLNCDGAADIHDINAFVRTLTSASEPGPFESDYTQCPSCHHRNADCNIDGGVDISHINPFVLLLVGGV